MRKQRAVQRRNSVLEDKDTGVAKDGTQRKAFEKQSDYRKNKE
jgi:hypothetical protein